MRIALLHIKSFLSSPKRYWDARERFRAHGSQLERWSQITSFDEDWDERTQIMANMVPPGSSVLEFGSGREQLEKLLPEGCRYQPSDIAKRSERTLVCDLNEGFPKLTESYDVILLAGVLEYIRDMDALFHAIRKHCRVCVVSHAPTDLIDCMATRIGGGWISHLTTKQLLRVFAHTGFHVGETKPWRYQIIYRLT